MKIMYDTNIILDVFQNRQPHYPASARCVHLALTGRIEGFFSAHAITTLFYILDKHTGRDNALSALKWMLETFSITACDYNILKESANSGIPDYEDAVVAFSAVRQQCDYVLSRDIHGFDPAPIKAISPQEFLDII